MNLLKETIEILKENKKEPEDVVAIIDGEFRTSWENFVEIADFEYDDGFGGSEICEILKIVGKDFWLERHEYDGSEWWEYKTMPNIELPERTFRKNDLLEE